MTHLDLPIRVGADGERLPPSGTDPYTLPWVQGAAATVHRQTRDKYREGILDLREKLSVLKSKRPAVDSDVPVFGPRRRPAGFHSLQGRPLPSDGRLFEGPTEW